VLALIGATLLVDRKLRALNRTRADIIALFPKEVGEFAYADLKKARTMPWFPQLQDRCFRTFPSFEKFLATAGVDPKHTSGRVGLGTCCGGCEQDRRAGKTVARSQLHYDRRANRWRRAGKLQSGVDGVVLQNAKSCPRSRLALHAVCFRNRLPAQVTCSFCLLTRARRRSASLVLEKMVEVRFGAEEGLLRNDKFFP